MRAQSVRHWACSLAATVSWPLLASSQGSRAQLASALSADTVAFVRVNVIPMDRERILWHQTVLVEAGRIVAVGAIDSVTVPANAKRIDGEDRYFVMPGLSEMHAHLRYRSDLLLLLANGVTTARNMRGQPFHLTWRREVERGTLLGPRFTTAGPILYGEDVNARTPEEARKAVDEQSDAGYDFIKVYDGLSKEAYEAIVAEAVAKHIPVAGHIPTSVGVEGALLHHQVSLEHAEEIVYHYFYNDLDDAKIPVIGREIAAAHAYVVPTLTIIGNWVAAVEHREMLLSRPEIRYVEPETYAWWRTLVKVGSGKNRVLDVFQDKIVRGFQDVGVQMMSGTDFYLIGVVPGYGLHRELQAMQHAGLTPYQVLVTTTRNPAAFLGDTAHRGTVAVGRDADLLVLDENPLVDVANATHQVGVMMRGRWFAASELQARVDSLAARFEPEQRLVDYILAHGGPAGAAFARASHEADSATVEESTLGLLGGAFSGQKRMDDAIAVFDLAAEVYPRSVSAAVQLGDAYAADGKQEEARRSYQRALSLDAHAAGVADKLRKLSP